MSRCGSPTDLEIVEADVGHHLQRIEEDSGASRAKAVGHEPVEFWLIH
jgi:hypothetical protein